MSAATSGPVAISLADISGTHDTGNGDVFENLLDEIVVGLEMLEECEGSSVKNGGFSPFPGTLLRKAKALSLMYERAPGPLDGLVWPGKAIEHLRTAQHHHEKANDRLGVTMAINAALHELGVEGCPTDEELIDAAKRTNAGTIESAVKTPKKRRKPVPTKRKAAK